MLKTPYQSTTHTSPDTSNLVWRVADKVRDEELQSFKSRVGNATVKPVTNIFTVGVAKLKSSALATFNKKVLASAEGKVYNGEDELDLLPQLSLSLGSEDEINEGGVELD